MTQVRPSLPWRAAAVLAALLAISLGSHAQAGRRELCASPGRIELNRRFVRDMRAKRLEDVLGLYTADAVFLNPDGSSVRDRTGLRKLYVTVFATYDSDLRLAPGKVRPAAARVIECVEDGAYEEDLRTRSTGEVHDVSGAYRFTTRRLRGGAWRFSRMEWTSR
jgi:ketosteroid isomerase-like protein